MATLLLSVGLTQCDDSIMVRANENRPHHSRLYLRNYYQLVAFLLAGRRLSKFT
jgi:hypothetical protein